MGSGADFALGPWTNMSPTVTHISAGTPKLPKAVREGTVSSGALSSYCPPNTSQVNVEVGPGLVGT